ncbi:hypothetical protein CPB85DRAFT_1375636 [Mucidula mucida]|nr:hypothetical protein CPB85DRAFT_1375636 [Mucidula mucida]
MATTPEAFLLITLENATLRTGSSIQTGTLGLECVTVPVHGQRDVFLVLRINDVELPIEHDRSISLDTSSRSARTYTLHPTDSDPNSVILDVKTTWHPSFVADVETFDGILAQYTQFTHQVTEKPIPAYVSEVSEKSRPLSDYRGHLVLVNEDSGEVVGEFDKKINVHEDPKLRERGHEKDPVVITVPEGKVQDDWMTKSATVVSHVITHGTSLFITVLSGASQLYINNSSPSPHHPANAVNATGPPKPPPRALVFLTSDKTRQNLSTAHAYTGKAVKISGKTIGMINGMIKKTMGSDKKGKGKAATTPPETGYIYAGSSPASAPPVNGYGSPYQQAQAAYQHNTGKDAPPSTPPSLPPNKPISRSTSPTPSYAMPSPGAPPPYYTSSSGYLTPNDNKPPLPPRSPSSSSRAPSPNPNQYTQGLTTPPALPPRKVSMTKRVLLSADLILSTIDVSTKRVLDAGTSRIGAVVGHKYGDQAGQNSEMMVGTARNVALVYVDMKGIGRKAILKTMGKEYVKGKFHSGKSA